MKYYIAVNGQQTGPVDECELPKYGITSSTLVWREGMTQWVPAGQVAELSYLFTQQPLNQPPSQPPYQQPQICPKTYLAEAILVTLLCCMPCGVVAIVKASGVTSAYNAGNIEGAIRASKSAGKWVKWGFFGSIALALAYIIFILVFCSVMQMPMSFI